MTQEMNYWSISSIILKKEAEKLWLTFNIISKNKNLFIISWNNKEFIFKSIDFGWNSSLWFKIANDKELTYKILEKNNFPIARSQYISKKNFENFDFEIFKDFKFPVIIKPIDEAHWNWVMMNVLSIKELQSKLLTSFEDYNNMIVQEQIEWDEIRVLVVKWKVLAAIKRKPAFIIWDGKNTIQKLIEIENETNELRWNWYEKPLSLIKIDDELISYISKNNYNLYDILEKNKEIQLRWNSNTWTWWTIINMTDKICDDIKKTCIEVAEKLWLGISWVDILTKDLTKWLSETWGIILEINATPWIWWDKELADINTGKLILKELFFKE